MRGISHSIPNPPPFSHSSVLQSAFLGPPRRSKLENNTLGKRNRSYLHSPYLTADQLHKRPRHAAAEGFSWSDRNHLPTPEPGQLEPWHQNDRFVRKFRREEFERAVAVPPNVSTQIDQFPLGNDNEFPIHPIFRSLTGLPESQYYNTPLTHIAPSPYQDIGLPDAERDLTIATLLSLVPHIALQISPDPRLSVRWAYTERATPPQHPTTGLASTYRALPQLFSTPAHLHETNNRNTNHPLLALNFQGTNALINISPSFLRILHPHTFPKPSAAQRLRASFMLGVTLVHELAHAVYMCRFPGPPLVPDTNFLNGSLPPPPPTQDSPPFSFPISYPPTPPAPHHPNNNNKIITLSNGKPFPHPHPHSPSTSPLLPAYPEHEPFYASHRKPELGHAWETSVFGSGRILSLASCDRFSLGLGWQRWPGADEFHVLNGRGSVVPLCRRGGIFPGGGGGGGIVPKYETVYPLSDAWVWQWFVRGFWERVEVEGLHTGTSYTNHGRSGLGKVEKKLGVRVRNYDWVRGDGGGGDGWDSDCSSRGRGADGDGVVREGQVGGGWESEVEGDGESDEDDGDDGEESEEEEGVD